MTRLNETTSGVFIIAATPFAENGDLDLEDLDRLMDFYIACGVDGITILGMMGEAQKLTYEESRRIAARVIRRAKDLPVVVGVSSAGFATIGELSRTVMDLGAAGVMIAPSASVRTDDGIVNFYLQAAQAIGEDVPFVLQDYPQASGVYISPEVVARVFEQGAQLHHAQARGLAGAWQADGASRSRENRTHATHQHSGRQWRAVLSRGAGTRCRRRDDRLFLP